MLKFEKVSQAQKFLIAYSTLMLMVVVLCCGLVLKNTSKIQNTASSTTIAYNYTVPKTVGVNKGNVQGTTTTNPFPLTATLPTDLKYNIDLTTPYKANTNIILQGKLPPACLNTDGFFCKGQLLKIDVCKEGVCPAKSYVFFAPDKYNSWKYEVSDLSIGLYKFVIADSNSTSIESVNFVVK